MSENKSVSGYHLGHLINNTAFHKQLSEDLKAILNLYEQGKIRMTIDSTFAFSKIGEAMKRMHSRQNIGKIILKPDAELAEIDKPKTDEATTVDQINITSTNESNENSQY